MNKILEKQIQKVKSKSKEGEFDINLFIKIINDFYEEIERERKLKDRSLELMSEELNELNKKIKLTAELQIKSIMENVTDGIIFLDKDMQVLFTNPSCLQIFKLNSINKEENLSKLKEIWKEISKNKNFNRIEPNIQFIQEYKIQEELIFIEVHLSSIPLFDEKGYLAIIRDYTKQKKEKLILKTNQAKLEAQLQESQSELEQLNSSLKEEYNSRKAAEATLEFLAYHDPLTGLFNRNYMKKLVSDNLASFSKNRHAILYLDLLGFKMLNDSLGHQIGDDTLRQVALRIIEVIRKKGNAFRLGGDEFVIFLTNIKNRLEVVRICQALLKRLTQNYSIDEYELHIDFSIGISLYPEDGLDLEMLMKTADTAMSVARNHGINHFMFYNPKMSLDVYEQLILSNRLKNAVEREEFELLYQPKLDLKKRKIVGFEALLRWNHPEKGLLSPIDFIQLAEQNRTIFKIGEWALNQTCILIKKLEAEGYNVSIAVNLSPIQFLKENIYKEIYKIIESTQIQPQLLEIEITESSIMKNIDYTVKALNLLKKIGVTISLDDFGTGYSSLSYLKIFPIHKVKIDKSFIQEIPESKKDTAILKAIVELAKSLELKTIVEGVETKVQLDYLNEINCDEVQGYLISKPLRKENIPKVLQKENWLI